jgi:hypothetical protein
LYKARERQRVIDPADLEATYFAADPETKPVFEYDDVMVWVSDPGHCRVERRVRGRDLHLVEYWDISSSFGEDASAIRDAVRCKLVETPRDGV